MVTESWVTLQDVCDHLKVSEDTVYRWMDKRGLPAHRIGRVWRFKLSQIDDWVQAGSSAAVQGGRDATDV